MIRGIPVCEGLLGTWTYIHMACVFVTNPASSLNNGQICAFLQGLFPLLFNA